MDDRIFNRPTHTFIKCLLMIAVVYCFTFGDQRVDADQPNWIWTPKTSMGASSQPAKECFFRKKLKLVGPEKAQIVFAAQDEYEIFLNDQLVQRGQSFGKEKTIEVTHLIEPGVNLIAVRVKHYQDSIPGLWMKFRVKERDETRWRSLATDASWKTRVVRTDAWTASLYSDLGWISAQETPADQMQQAIQQLAADKEAAQKLAAQEAERAAEALRQQAERAATFKASMQTAAAPEPKMIKSTPLEADQSQPAADQTDSSGETIAPPKKSLAVMDASQFKIDDEFKVERVMSHSATGSITAMEFDEFGKILLAQENGPLLIADPDPSGDADPVRVYCDEVKSCQGILALNGSVYVTGYHGQKLGLFELVKQKNRDRLMVKQQLLSFTNTSLADGPHGIQLGPDGMLYVVVGKGSQMKDPFGDISPYAHPIADDSISPATAPGMIVRVSRNGLKVERVAGGLRNAQDLIMDGRGEIFIHDSGSSEDTPWNRPSMLYHVPGGSELGWREGRGKFPAYRIDQLPAITTVAAGSPAGAVKYEHVQFPRRYHGALFFADAVERQIFSIIPSVSNAGLTGTAQVFLTGHATNVRDLTVGPDGGLYFCAGGQGSDGGVYRVSWKGQTPKELVEFDTDLLRAIRHPQPQSAWARQSIAEIRLKMGSAWVTGIEDAVLQTENSATDRLRALQLMNLYGPAPSLELLTSLAADTQPEIRAQVAKMCVRQVNKQKEDIVLTMVQDSHPDVRRVACECCIRIGTWPTLDALTPMLSSSDRVQSQAARRLLEHMPVYHWQDQVIDTENKTMFCNGTIALMTVKPSLQQSYEILAASSHLLDGFLSDREFLDLLRAVQVALTQGSVDPSRIPGLTQRMVGEFPSKSSAINRELARVLEYLKAGSFDGRLVEYLNDPQTPPADKLFVSTCLINNKSSLSESEQIAVANTIETIDLSTDLQHDTLAHQVTAVDHVVESPGHEDIETVLANGHQWPKTALNAFFQLPEKLTDTTVGQVIAMDQRIVAGATDRTRLTDDAKQLRLGVIAVLARDGSETGMDYLRQRWQQEPERRSEIVIGLAQQPAGKNWPYLVGSLPELDDLTCGDVLVKLQNVAQRPREAQYYRQVIEAGYRLRDQGAADAADLLQHWSGDVATNSNRDWQQQLENWTQWYQQKFPSAPAVNRQPAGSAIANSSEPEARIGIAAQPNGVR